MHEKSVISQRFVMLWVYTVFMIFVCIFLFDMCLHISEIKHHCSKYYIVLYHCMIQTDTLRAETQFVTNSAGIIYWEPESSSSSSAVISPYSHLHVLHCAMLWMYWCLMIPISLMSAFSLLFWGKKGLFKESDGYFIYTVHFLPRCCLCQHSNDVIF